MKENPYAKYLKSKTPSQGEVNPYAKYSDSAMGQNVAPLKPPKEDLYGWKRAGKDLLGATQAAVTGAGQGLTFGFADELQSGLAATIASSIAPDLNFSDAYSGAMEELKKQREASAEKYPAAFYPSEVAGALGTGGVILKKTGGTGVAKFLTNSPIKGGAAVGGLSGALYGAGAGEEGMAERLKSAGISGLVGGVTGGAASAIAPKVGNILERVITKKPPIKAPSPINTQSLDDLLTASNAGSAPATITPAVENKALNKVAKAIKADFPDNWQEVLQAWKNGDKPLAKVYGSRITTLAKGAAQFPEGKALAEKYFDKQTGQSLDKVRSAISKNVSSVEAYHATAADLLQSGRVRAAPFYEAAFSDNTTPYSRKLNELLQQPEIKTGLKKGIRIQRIESAAAGKAFNPEDYAIKRLDWAGNIIADKIPNLRMLDAGKRGLDSMISAQTDAVTGKTTELGRALIKLKSSYVDELKNINPNYKKALEVSGDYLEVDKAIKRGRNFYKLDPEKLSIEFNKLSPLEKDAFKIGVGKKLRDASDIPEGANPYNRVFGKYRSKLAEILSPAEYRGLENSMKAEDRLFKMRDEVLGGSPSVGKLVAMSEITNAGQEILNSIPSGGVKSMALSATRKILGKFFSGLSNDTAGAVSNLIYETDPQKKVMLIEKMMGNKALSLKERELARQVYFNVDSFLNSRTKGAIAASVLVNEGVKE